MTAAERYKIADVHFTLIEHEMIDDIEASAYPKSLIVLYSITRTLDQLKDGIVATQNKPYAAHIILRSIIENFLLTFYFFLKIKIDKSDKVGEEFMDFYANSEFLKQESYSLQLDDIKNGIKRVVGLRVLQEKYSFLNDLSQSDLHAYHESASQFTNIKKMGQFILDNKNIEPTIDKLNHMVFELLDIYNILSSIVHGGPYAMRTFVNGEQGHIQYIPYSSDVLADWGYTMVHIAKVTLVLTLRNEVDSKYAKNFTAMYSMDNPLTDVTDQL